MTKHGNSRDKGTGELLHALAEPTRNDIMNILLSEVEQTVAQFCSHFQFSTPAISQHLKVLREAGAIDVEKKAQYRVYSVNPEAILELEEWTTSLRRMWERRFAALGKVVDRQNSEVDEEGGFKLGRK